MSADDHMLLAANHAKRVWRFDLVIPLFIRPRTTLTRLAADSYANWQTPMLLLSIATLTRAAVSGWVRGLAEAGEAVALPPGYENFTPEQMAQFQQPIPGNSSLIDYFLPAVGAFFGVIIAWLIVGWLLHLVLTLIGGRSTSQATLNMVAWASLPLLLRFGIQTVGMLVTQTSITAPGLSGFAPAGSEFTATLLGAVLAQVDIYLMWQIVLLVIGVRLVGQLPVAKSWVAVLVVLVGAIVSRALAATILIQLRDMIAI